MLEIGLAILVIAAILIVSWATKSGVASPALIGTGFLVLLIGILEGVPTGLYYHIVLYRILKPRNRLPPGWWISPKQYHVHLTETERRRVMRWFILGGTGFLFCLIGGLIALAGMYLAF
jgi:hypothetical protein